MVVVGAGEAVIEGDEDAIEQPQETDSTSAVVSRIPSPSMSPISHKRAKAAAMTRGYARTAARTPLDGQGYIQSCLHGKITLIRPFEAGGKIGIYRTQRVWYSITHDN